MLKVDTAFITALHAGTAKVEKTMAPDRPWATEKYNKFLANLKYQHPAPAAKA